MPSILNFNTQLLRSRRTSMMEPSLPFIQPPPREEAEGQDPPRLVCNEALFQSTMDRLNHPDESLWALGKHLKAQQEEEEDMKGERFYHSTEGCFRRAIRIILYHAKGGACHPKYYRKCTEIEAPVACGCCPPHVVSILLQVQASAKHLSSSVQCSSPTDGTVASTHSRSSSSIHSSSRRSSSSSSSSISISTTLAHCTRCGKEKRGMPVCAKCKAQAYCSLRCLHEHSVEHKKTCVA